MYKIKILTSIEQKKWNEDLLKSGYSTFFQTTEYLTANSGIIPIFIQICDENDQVVGQLGLHIIKSSALYSSSVFRKLLKLITVLTNRGIWIYGPIIHSGDHSQRLEIIRHIIEANDRIMKDYNLVFMEGFSPPLDLLVDESYLSEFKKSGYYISKFVTYITDLNQSLDDIWKKIQKYTKTNVKRATKRGIITKELTTRDELKEVLLLHQKWAETKGLVISNPYTEIEKLWKRHESGLEKTFLAYIGNELISSLSLSCFNGIAVPTQVLNSYLKATSLGGPALTWNAMLWAKNAGMKTYDITGGPFLLDGEPDPDNTRPLTHYKRKWGGSEQIHYNFLKVRRKFFYTLYKMMFRLIRHYHNLISKSRSRPMDTIQDE